MSCGLELEKLQDFAKQLEEQSSTLATQIQTLETQLKQAQNSYLKVMGAQEIVAIQIKEATPCLLYTSPSPRDGLLSRMPSSA